VIFRIVRLAAPEDGCPEYSTKSGSSDEEFPANLAPMNQGKLGLCQGDCRGQRIDQPRVHIDLLSDIRHRVTRVQFSSDAPPGARASFLDVRPPESESQVPRRASHVGDYHSDCEGDLECFYRGENGRDPSSDGTMDSIPPGCGPVAPGVGNPGFSQSDESKYDSNARWDYCSYQCAAKCGLVGSNSRFSHRLRPEGALREGLGRLKRPQDPPPRL